MSAQDLISSIDPCTGQASLTIPLLGQSGIGGLDLSLTAAYYGGTLAVATGWNQDTPTGILGLGWSIGGDRIVARYAQSALTGDAIYVLQLKGARSQLVCIGVGADGVSNWAAAQYRFWRISFDPSLDLWTVIDEDGLIYLFGDATSGRSTVDFGVAWGGWTAANGVGQGQRAIAVGWSLAEVGDLFGNRLTYSYAQVDAQVSQSSGLFYTQASYLSTITGVDGSVLTLNYTAKTAAEYQDPHPSPSPPNGWQDRFETQFLSSAAIADSSGNPIASVALGYAIDLGSGGLVKRVLTSITRLSAAGEPSEPLTLFSYYGENGSDGVSASTIFAGSALYGAIKTVTLPTGGTLTYAYQAAPLSYADRALAVTPQAGWTDPVVYAGDEQVLVTWSAGATAHVMSYVWDGRWIATEVMQVALGTSTYSSLQIASGEGCCAARIGGTLYAAARDRTRTGAWFPAASFSITSSIGASESATLACGKGFAALLGATAGKLLTFRFTGTGIAAGNGATGWVADAEIGRGASGAGFTLAAKGAVLVALTVPASGSATLWLGVLAAAGTWNLPAIASLPAGLSNGNLTVQCGEGFAIASSFAATPGGYIGNCVACWWNASGNRISSQLWPSNFAVTPTAPVIAGSTVVSAPTVHRFTGATWRSFALGSITYPNVTGDPVLSVGSDAIGRTFTTTAGASIADLLVYDPVGGSWSVPNGLNVTGSGTAPLAAVAAQTRSSVANYAVVGTKLWYRDASAGWTAAVTLPAGMTAADLATIRLIGNSYLVFQTGTATAGVSTTVYLLKNGAATAAPSQPAAGQQIALAAGVAGTTVARSGFVTFTATFGAPTSQMALYRPVFGDVSGAQKSYTVASVTSVNGYASENGVNGQVATAFGYQKGTIDLTGTIPFFNTVTAVPGQPAIASPANGTVATAYYNGLVAAELPATPYPTAGNGSSYTRALRGTLYQTSATRLSISSTAALGGTAANLVDGVTIKNGDVLAIAGTPGVPAFTITFGASESLDQLNATLAASNLTASLDSANRLVITTIDDASKIGAVTFTNTGGGTATFTAAQTAVAQTALSHLVTLLPLGNAGVGAYHRAIQQARMRDGVTSTDSFTYDAASGFTRSKSTEVVNAAGTADAFSEQYTYFYEQYDASRTLNLLSPVVQRIRKSQPAGVGSAATVGIDVVAWRDWSGGNGQWAPEREYRGLNANAIFTAWDSGQSPPVTDFVLTSQITARASTGAPVETVDALGARGSIAYDQAALRPVAGAANCPAGQMVWYGCEPYESSGAWVVNGAGRSIGDYITTADYHSGTRSIALPANAPQTGPLLALVPADQTRRYLFSCWARTTAAFNPQNGVAQWTLTFYNPATLAQVGAAIQLVLTPASGTPSAVGQWAYFQVTIDLPKLVAASQLPALRIGIQATNANTAQLCYVDELRFMPIDCGFTAQVYAPSNFRPTAAIDSNGQSIQLFYDKRDRQYLSTGPDGRVLGLQIATYSRWATGTDSFSPTLPNLTLSLRSSVGSVYYDFHNGNAADWTFGTASSWSIAGGALTYTGTTGNTATCGLLAAPNQAARVTVKKSATASASVALGNGKYLMRWTNPAGSGNGTWTLEDTAPAQVLATNGVAPFDTEWLFAVIDGFVIGYAGSVQLFAYALSPPPSITALRKIELTATATTSFDDLTILQDPSFTLTATDGLRQPFSKFSLLGYQPAAGNVLFPGKWVLSASHLFYDPLGRPYVAGQPLKAPLQMAPPAGESSYSLITADQGTYLYDAQGNQVAVPTYLTGSQGRTFSQAGYGASPLGRIADFDAPRSAYATGTYYCTRQTLRGSAATVGAAPASGAGKYHVRRDQALRQNSAVPNPGAAAVTILDQTTTDSAGRLLMQQSGPVGGTLLQMGYSYNAAGLLATINHPNYYSPPVGTVAANWQENLSYNFLGQLVSRTAPDSGTKQWAYDSLGRPRFLYLASGAPVQSGAATILYMKYDGLGRAVETGYIRDLRYAWSAAALTAMLDVAAFPIIVTTPNGPNQATGAIGAAYGFDTDGVFTGSGASFTRFLIGRMAKAAITSTDGESGPDTESYLYDASGNVVAKTTVMPDFSPASGWTVATSYNLDNQPLSITYPNMLATKANPNPAGQPVKVGYGYDRLGRLAAVGGQATGAIVDPAHPPSPLDMSYAGYAYDTFGRPIAAQYNNGGGAFGAPITRSFAYDDDQRLTATSSPYFAEGLSYDSSATVSGWSYFNSAVTQATTAYPGGVTSPQPPSPFSLQFSYDGYGRLAAAVNSLGAGYSLTMGAGGAAYDANGNILGKTIGASAIKYVFTTPSGTNRVTSLTTTASAAVDFSQSTPMLNGWAYQSSNGGPSSSGLTTTTPVSGNTQALKLAGGSERHYELLRLATFLTPGASYTLAWSAATDATYPAAPGSAVDGAEWFAVLYGAGGPFAALPLATLAASTAWTAGTATIDLTPTTLAQLAGDAGDIASVSIELRNRCLGANGAPGAAVYIKSASVAAVEAPATASSYGYDADGNITSSSGRALGQIAYDAVTGLTSSVTVGAVGSTSSVAFAYGANGLRSRATVTPPTGTASRTFSITGPDGSLLATQNVSGTAVTATYYLNGAEGPFARLTDSGGLGYLFGDRLGSLRAVVDGPSGAPLATRDFGAFGDGQRSTGASGTDIGYTGQRLDAATGLYNYNARLYDPLLGRFYATDPAGQYSSPYSYVGNDPVNATDPSGAISARLARIIADKWDTDLNDDFFIVEKLFSDGNAKLLNEYYYDALPNIIWNKKYPKGGITITFGTRYYDSTNTSRLDDFTQGFSPKGVDIADSNVIYYAYFPGQSGRYFDEDRYTHLFLQFLRVAMVKSSQIYVNLAGLSKRPIVDAAFNNPDAIVYFFNFTGGFDPGRVNMTSVDYFVRALPELSADLKTPGGNINTSAKLYNSYSPGHTAWEIATIISNSTFRDKATFFNGTWRWSYEEYQALVRPTPVAAEVAAHDHDEL